jgi:trimethylamine--corrinoid protein Co-methyltransferase
MHQATLQILNTIGIATTSEKFKELLLNHGCKQAENRITFPPEIVERYLKMAPSHFNLYGRDGETVVELGKRKAYAQSISGTPLIMDLETGERREYMLQDLANMCRLADSLPSISIISCGVPKDVDADIYMLMEITTMLRNTRKPLRLPIESGVELEYISQVLSVVCGNMDKFREKPCLYLEISPISPLNFAKEQAEGIIGLAELGIPIGMIPCNMMGATGPMTLIGSVVQQNAEVVAGIVAAQMVRPGAKVVMSPRVTFMDMKTGVGLWAAPEMGIAGACSVELGHYYNLPVSVAGYSAASKIADQQSGYERCYNALLSALTGADIIAAAGALDNALAASYTQLVLDDEIASMIGRTFRELDVSDDALAVDVVADIVNSNTSFLEHIHTIKHLRKGELWEPTLTNRLNYVMWAETKETIEDRARKKATKLLAANNEPLFDSYTDEEIEKIIIAAKQKLAKKHKG